jgi:POT family proton-dependent oligopeptide transporter
MIPLVLLLVSNSTYTDYFMWTVGPVVLAWFVWSMLACTAEEAKKLVVALVLVLFSIMFWGIFEQSGGSLAIVAENNLATSEKDTLPISINNSSNSVFVILFAPLLGILWMKMKDKEPDSVVKFALGFVFLAVGYWVFQSLIQFADPTGHSSLAVFTTAYFLVTVGELCLSPIGLSAMTKLAPRRMYGVMMGMWFLASAYGQYVAGQLGASMASPNPNATKLEKLQSYTDGYGQLAIYAVICAVLMLALSPMLKKLAKGSA